MGQEMRECTFLMGLVAPHFTLRSLPPMVGQTHYGPLVLCHKKNLLASGGTLVRVTHRLRGAWLSLV